ncbi:MAG: peptidase M23 [Lysobacteraceae bacterium]|nr:MAG: peptidase M23 [Xanthomonadaceae bacterium]
MVIRYRLDRQNLQMRLLLILLLCLPMASNAKKIYQYVDEDGITHFTDVAPDTEQTVSSRTVRVDNPKMITLRTADLADGSRDVFVFNHWWGPAELKVRFPQRTDIQLDGPAQRGQAVLPAYLETRILNISATGPRAAFEMSMSATPGDPDAVVDEEFVYAAPFAGNRFVITQAFNGEFTHAGRQNRYAIDIALPEGTPVVAARAGVVMSVEDDYFNEGTRPEYAARANNVRVIHGDGGMAVYAHLLSESVVVRPGQRVRLGQKLGLSGNTGFSSGPHLHFVVQRNQGGELTSVPFTLADGFPQLGQLIWGQ